MKSKLIALALVLISVIGSLAVTTSSAGTRTIPLDESFGISEYGTLIHIFDGEGNSRFGPLNLNGFLLSYRFNGRVETVSANGESDRTGITSGQRNLYGRSANITVETHDHALEITNYFSLDEQTKKLTIRLSVRNKSDNNQPLSLLTATLYVDPGLIGARAVDRAPLLIQAPLQFKAKSYENSQLMARPPTRPPCLTVICTQNEPSRPLLAIPPASDSAQNRISLQWHKKRPTLIVPQSQASVSGNAVKQADFIVLVDLKETAN